VSRPRGAPSPSPDGDDHGYELEQELIVASRTGDTEAFGKLYTKYRGAVYAVCLKLLQDPESGQDAVQDVFLKAFLSLPTFKTGRPLRPWLVSIARRRCIDIRRRGMRDMEIQRAAAEKALLPQARTPFNDDTFEQMLRARNMVRLQRALAKLSPRQRRALMLSAIDGWSYDSIASAEGSSTPAINMLLVRARRKLREAWESLGAIVVAPWRSLRDPTKMPFDGLLTATAPALLAIGLVLIMTIYPQLPAPGQTPASAGNDTALASQAARTVTLAQPAQPKGFNNNPKPESKPPAPAPVPALPGTATAVLEPTPEGTHFRSIAPSPDYESNHTVFALGDCQLGGCLFVSHDGGASWELLPALGLQDAGATILLPPNHQLDGRMFAMSSHLLESLDGGKTFVPVSPVFGLAAVSPGFASGDRRIIILGSGLYEYLVDERLTRPLSLASTIDDLNAYFTTMALPPAFPRNPTFFVGRSTSIGAGLGAGAFRCTIDRCEDTALKELPTKITFSPAFEQDRAIYASLQGGGLVRSVDMMNSYQRLNLPDELIPSTATLAIASARGSARLFLAGWLVWTLRPAADWPKIRGNVHLSEDHGASWKTIPVDLPTFNQGTGVIAVAPTGRLFVSSLGHGLACSEDGGFSWKARCSSES
jgi:RNA polymerase sigma-70 factor, ECF subfamily